MYNREIKQRCGRLAGIGGRVSSLPTLDELIDSGLDSCALDVAARGKATLEQIAESLYLSRERIRQIEKAVLLELEVSSREELEEYWYEGADRDRDRADDGADGADGAEAGPGY